MEKAFPPVLSNFNFVVVAGYGPVKMPPVYAFRTPISLPFQDFPGMVGGQAGTDYPIPARTGLLNA